MRRIKAFAFCGVFQPFHLKPVWRGRAGGRNPAIVNKKTILSEFFSSITFRQYQRTNTHPHTNTLCAVVSGFLMKAIRRLTFKPGRQSLPLFQHTRTNQNTNICVYVGAEQGCVNGRYMSVFTLTLPNIIGKAVKSTCSIYNDILPSLASVL